MKILITGGAGFIGSHVADAYLAAGHEVIVVDNLSSGKRSNIPPKVKFYELSIEQSDLQGVIQDERPDVINHHAAQIDVRKSMEDPLKDAGTNIIGTLNLLKAAIKYETKKFIFASSGGAIYGDPEHFPADENHPAKPVNPYGIGKYTAERYLHFFRERYDLSFVSLRYANVYGPRQNAHGEAGVIAIFTERLLRGKAPVINGDGKQTRDYVYVDDVVTCNVEALKQGVQGIFNVGTGIETNVNQIAQELITLAGNHVIPQYAPEKPGEQRRSCLRSGVIQKTPPTPLTSGLRRTVEWFRNNPT